MGAEMIKHRYSSLVIAALTIAGANAAVAADAGAVTFATGTVTAERQPAAPLSKGDTVLAEDFVITGDASRAQLLMIDDAKIAIRPNSRVQIEEYVYASTESTAGPAVVTSEDNSSVLNLVKGGFRTITGAIGKEDPADYEVRTAVGVLGIRGTDFVVLLCGGDCDTAPGVTPGAVVPDGLYLWVIDGSIVFSNEVATIELSAGEYAYIPFDTRQPTRLDTAPAVFVDDTDFRFGDDLDGDGIPDPPDDAAPPAGFDAALGTRRAPDTSATESSTLVPADTDQDEDDARDPPAQQIRGIDRNGDEVDLTPGSAPDPQGRTIGFSTGPLGAVDNAWSFAADNLPGEYSLDGNDDLTGFTAGYPLRAGADTATFDIGSAANVDTGVDAVTVLRWGRWAGGTAGITLSDGSDASQDLGAQSIHWISSPQWAAPPVMPISGTASYTLIGNTPPTDNFGNTGVLGSATFDADFTNMLVDSTLVIDINGANWSAAGQGNLGAAAQLPAHLFQGIYNNVTITDPTGTSIGTGNFSGFFSEAGPASDPSFPGGVGLTFGLQDQGGTTTVSGAAAFGNP
jgi:hypothetical protein